MVRTTERLHNERSAPASTPRFARAALVFVACVALIALAGCSGGKGAATGSSPATTTVGAHMAGPAVDVHILQSAVNARPKPWVLTSPKSAVTSYLDWTSYAYRTGQSVVATKTMSADEEVRVDSYIQLNIQKSRLIDQKLTSITFGKPSAGTTNTVLPAKEHWTYSYLSIAEGNKVLGGPYTVIYNTKYTVIKNKTGDWVVDSVKATAEGTVK
jgi:hypothetical protein